MRKLQINCLRKIEIGSKKILPFGSCHRERKKKFFLFLFVKMRKKMSFNLNLIKEETSSKKTPNK